MKMNKILNGVLVSAMALSMVSSVSATEVVYQNDLTITENAEKVFIESNQLTGEEIETLNNYFETQKMIHSRSIEPVAITDTNIIALLEKHFEASTQEEISTVSDVSVSTYSSSLKIGTPVSYTATDYRTVSPFYKLLSASNSAWVGAGVKVDIARNGTNIKSSCDVTGILKYASGGTTNWAANFNNNIDISLLSISNAVEYIAVYTHSPSYNNYTVTLTHVNSF